MKLYLSNINFQNININNLNNYITSKDDILEMYSDEGLYICKNGEGFKKLQIIDGNVKILNDYINDNHLYIDESYIYKSKQYISKLPINHYIIKLIKYEFKFSQKSPVTMVLETENNIVSNIYFMLTEKHAKYSTPDIDNQFIKETIQDFYNKIINDS
tara:strand:+ start:742 stop:1215 length:474 start_codon:yes stop_codon:yes gene_type:complete